MLYGKWGVLDTQWCVAVSQARDLLSHPLYIQSALREVNTKLHTTHNTLYTTLYTIHYTDCAVRGEHRTMVSIVHHNMVCTFSLYTECTL